MGNVDAAIEKVRADGAATREAFERVDIAAIEATTSPETVEQLRGRVNVWAACIVEIHKTARADAERRGFEGEDAEREVQKAFLWIQCEVDKRLQELFLLEGIEGPGGAMEREQ
jgi:hypothetical protein